MPPKCKTCLHPEVKTINSQIRSSVSLRDIALQFGMSHTSVNRHIETCLGLTIGALIEQKKIKQAIDVYEEFREQLAFAKEMRVAARAYLSDPNDPLRMTIIPRADEIEVVYFDYMDRDEKGNPKKKTAFLNVLLASIEEGKTIEADKVQIKHVDLRKFALDAINTTDTCIDKFAKMGGAYQQDKPNADASASVVTSYQHWLQDQREGQTIFDAEYTILDDKTIMIHGYEPSDAQKAKWLTRNAEARGVDVSIPAEKAGVDIGTIG